MAITYMVVWGDKVGIVLRHVLALSFTSKRHEHNVARVTSKKIINSEYSELAHNWL